MLPSMHKALGTIPSYTTKQKPSLLHCPCFQKVFYASIDSWKDEAANKLTACSSFLFKILTLYTKQICGQRQNLVRSTKS